MGRHEPLGFFPCSNEERYYSIEVKEGNGMRVALVRWAVDIEDMLGIRTNYLFFQGCDDGHVGLPFKTKQEALDWIRDCPYVDFAKIVAAGYSGELKLSWFN